MSLDHRIRAIAGAFILISLGLACRNPLSDVAARTAHLLMRGTHWVNPNWLWFTAFIGINLLQSAFTHFCLMAIILKKLGWAGPATNGPSTYCCG